MVHFTNTCCLLVVISICHVASICQDNQTDTNTLLLKRNRRYLIFPKGARNGIRVNFKHNRVVPITSILAYSDGMRLTWDLPTKPNDLRPKFRRREQRRDVLEFLEQMLTTYGLDGEACVFRALCEAAARSSPATGLIRKILHLIFTIPQDESGDVASDRYSSRGVCDSSFAHRCPFSLLGPSVVEPLHEINPLD